MIKNWFISISSEKLILLQFFYELKLDQARVLILNIEL